MKIYVVIPEDSSNPGYFPIFDNLEDAQRYCRKNDPDSMYVQDNYFYIIEKEIGQTNFIQIHEEY
jgi:hypothetical protein